MHEPSTPAATPPAASPDDRLHDVPEALKPQLHAAARAIRDGALPQAFALLEAFAEHLPEHPEGLRLQGVAHTRAGRFDAADATLRRALSHLPDDALLHSDLAAVRRGMGDVDGALALWRRACELAPGLAMPWFNLGRNLQGLGHTDGAIAALAHACTLAPDLVPAQVLLGDALVHRGRLDDAQAHYRAALAQQPGCGDAWRGLSNIKTRALDADDIAQLRAQLADTNTAPADRIAMRHALGKALEDRGEFESAYQAFVEANVEQRRRASWNAVAFMQHVGAVVGATPAPQPGTRGDAVIFIVGLPRSGSTLVEQLLAAHPLVDGASELPDLEAVLHEESQRRQQPQWARAASAADWQRLGDAYLQRTARWRVNGRMHTDKMPANWLYTGVLRAMLPGARIVDVRRDAVETGLSCFKQQFYRLPHFACALTDIAAYTVAHDQAMDYWQRQDPQRIRVQQYEALQADLESELRALLAFCGLPYDATCLRFNEAARSVRTASAAQVREPLRRDTARAAGYGALLDPLRAALAQLRQA